MKHYHKNRLLKLADFLEKLPRKKFNFSEVVSEIDEKNKCGTVACAVGWCPVVFPRHWKYAYELFEDGSIDWAEVELKSQSAGWEDDAMKFFGLDCYSEIWGLFIPESNRDWAETRLLENATPKQVAHSIRQFVAWKEAGSQC